MEQIYKLLNSVTVELLQALGQLHGAVLQLRHAADQGGGAVLQLQHAVIELGRAGTQLGSAVLQLIGPGIEGVGACGGVIYTSAVEAALKSNGYVIGVDVDQNYIGVNGVADGSFAYNPFITSAMKGLTEAVNTALSDIEAGDWSDIAASNGNFGLEDGDYIGLPTADDSWNFETFTTEEYEEVKDKIKNGEITVDNSSDDATKPTVSEFTTVNYIQ